VKDRAKAHHVLNLLVLDTATDRCALACSVGGKVFENTRSIPRLHNKYLLEMLSELFDAAEINPRALSAIGFAAGPGSFTGIRISAAVSQALAVGADASVVPLSSSRLLAHAAKRTQTLREAGVGNEGETNEGETNEGETRVVGIQTVLRSRAKFAYLGSFEIGVDGRFERVMQDRLMDDAALLTEPLPSGWVRVMDASTEEAAALGAVPVALDVADLLALTAQALARGATERATERELQIDTSFALPSGPVLSRRLLVLCPAPAVIPDRLLAQLPGLVLTTEVAITETNAVRELMQQHQLDTDFLLLFERDELLLCRADKKGRFGNQRISLDTSALARRQAGATELHRACLASNPGAAVQVLDLFAGWGMDGFALAAAGARVTCVELQPAMVALLRDATRRVHADVSAQVEVVHGDALGFLAGLGSAAMDVIYLDPMFPARNKGALPNQRLQWLAELASGDSMPVDTLLEAALGKAKMQVVLKRRRKDPVVGAPQRQVSGSSVRYDIYT